MGILISYRYKRGGECVKDKKGNLPAQMSHHHIISYPRIYFLGVLSLVYLKRLEEDGQSIDARVKLLERVARIENKSIYQALKKLKMDRGGIWLIPLDGYSIYETLCRIAWMPMNLFTGPSAKFRMDDPVQRNDKIPLSMQGERRRKIEKMKSGLDKYAGNINIPCESQGADCIVFRDENMFQQLMSDFFSSLDENAGCYESKISDWYVGISGTREACRTKRRYHVCKNTDMIVRDRGDRNVLNAKFGVVDDGVKQVLDHEKMFQIVSINSTEVKGVISKGGFFSSADLSREIRSVFL